MNLTVSVLQWRSKTLRRIIVTIKADFPDLVHIIIPFKLKCLHPSLQMKLVSAQFVKCDNKRDANDNVGFSVGVPKPRA
jgi:hypothetical protein